MECFQGKSGGGCAQRRQILPKKSRQRLHVSALKVKTYTYIHIHTDTHTYMHAAKYFKKQRGHRDDGVLCN